MDAVRSLVTGGTRSGKSSVAEGLLREEARVVYVATGPAFDDADWQARVAAHRSRRPPGWTTIETDDPASVLRTAGAPVLLDCLGTWLTRQLDELDAWQAPLASWEAELAGRQQDLVAAWQQCRVDAVAVTNEVGWGVVSEHRSARLFTDALGRLNQQVARASDRVLLVVAGHVLPLREP